MLPTPALPAQATDVNSGRQQLTYFQWEPLFLHHPSSLLKKENELKETYSPAVSFARIKVLRPYECDDSVSIRCGA